MHQFDTHTHTHTLVHALTDSPPVKPLAHQPLTPRTTPFPTPHTPQGFEREETIVDKAFDGVSRVWVRVASACEKQSVIVCICY